MNYSERWRCKSHTGSLALLFAILLLSGCGGGGSGDEEENIIIGTGFLLKGTVASERVLARNDVDVKASSGETTTASIGANGRFEKQIEGDSPYLLRVDLGNNRYQYSIGHRNGTEVIQNVHSYSDATVRNWFAQQGQDVDSQFASSGAISLPDEQEYSEIFDSLQSIVSLVREDYGIGNVDLATASFDADDSGIDQYLNQNPVIINNGQITIIINDSTSGTQSTATTELSIDTDLAAADTESPTIPDSVRVLPSGNDELVVVWEPSDDNVGVNGYQVYRDGSLIATTAFPVYSDTGLAGNTQFTYSIAATDSAGNTSDQSVPELGITSDLNDVIPPPAPVALTAVASTQSIQLNWSQSSINDVARFEVRRSATDANTDPYLNVTSTFVTDVNVEAGTQYCYQIVAIDPVENRSPPSEIQCATTGGATVVTMPSTQTVSVGLASSSYQVAENAASVAIAITRTGTSATSVDYATADGTATSGQDYTESSGTLTWLAGDTSPRTIVVQVTADDLDEGNETFRIVLSNTDGSLSTSESTVTIADVTSVGCGTEFPESVIDSDLSLAPGCYAVETTISIRDGGNLTLAPGTTLTFGSGRGVTVASGGSFTAVGTSAQPILLTGAEPTPGFWNGVIFNNTNSLSNVLDGVVLDYAGGGSADASIEINSSSTSPTRVRINNTTIRNSSKYGVLIENGSLVDSFSNNILTANDAPVTSHPNAAGALTENNMLTGNTNDHVSISQGVIEDSITWNKLAVPYLVTGDLTVDEALTIAAGTTINFDSGAGINVRTDGALIAVGTQAETITFTGQESVPGIWDGIKFTFSTSTQNKLEHVIIEYAGSTTNNDANLYLDSLSSIPSRISLSNVVLQNSIGKGFDIESNSLVAEFSNITSTLNNTPGTVGHEIVNAFGQGLSFTGNTTDVVSVRSSTEDQPVSWPNMGVPYLSDGMNLRANLTIAAGVEIIMQSGAELAVSQDGSLTAIGTTVDPIIFRGEQAIAGYWDGLAFTFTTSIQNVLENIIISDGGGGGTPGTSANIELSCLSSIPTRLSLTNAAINNSAGWGIITEDDCNLTTSGVTYSGNVQGTIDQ